MEGILNVNASFFSFSASVTGEPRPGFTGPVSFFNSMIFSLRFPCGLSVCFHFYLHLFNLFPPESFRYQYQRLPLHHPIASSLDLMMSVVSSLHTHTHTHTHAHTRTHVLCIIHLRVVMRVKIMCMRVWFHANGWNGRKRWWFVCVCTLGPALFFF